MTTPSKTTASVTQRKLTELDPRANLRAQLMAQRIDNPEHVSLDEQICQKLLTVLEKKQPKCLAFYWPIRGEADIRPAVISWLRADPKRQAALPLVVQARSPLSFYRWSESTEMGGGAYGVPVPVNEPLVQPDMLLIPCIGFSQERNQKLYRLGYGGGYYDRTLAKLNDEGKAPRVIGIAHHFAQQKTLKPKAHDWPLDIVVTDKDVIF